MKKREFVATLAIRCGITGARANEFVDHFRRLVTETMIKGEDVALTGLGTFKVLKRSARKCRNPKTGETISTPEATVAKFTMSKTLKNLVSGKNLLRRSSDV